MEVGVAFGGELVPLVDGGQTSAAGLQSSRPSASVDLLEHAVSARATIATIERTAVSL